MIGQLLETTLLNLVNFPSLIATNAARMRLAAGPGKSLLEFGLRRAQAHSPSQNNLLSHILRHCFQGPDGGMSASRYAYIGGFDGTSNVQCGKYTGIHVSGTHAHSFVQSHQGWDDIKDPQLVPKNGGEPIDFVARVKVKYHHFSLKYGHAHFDFLMSILKQELRKSEDKWGLTNLSELAAFVAYAQSFPNNFLSLVDTYDTLQVKPLFYFFYF